MATLTYAFSQSTAVLGPLATQVEPSAYDLCAMHAARTSAPVGWEIIRLPLEPERPRDDVASDDLLALADAVREAGLAEPRPNLAPQPAPDGKGRHLRLVRD